MIYSLDLPTACLLAGLVLLVLGGLAAARPAGAGEWLRKFPRSRGWGLALLILAAGWFWYLIQTIDLGEFTSWRSRLLIIIPVAAILTARFVDELLAARALGMLVLLAAEPLLEAAFLRPEASRLFLVTITYIFLTVAMFWIGMPYVLRDQISWLNSSPARLRGAGALAAVYGAILLICSLTLHRSV